MPSSSPIAGMEILAAAQRCFVRSGFHGASMQDICAEAGMSPGNLYRYFPSKEALIAGIAERDRAEVAQQFAARRSLQGFFAVLEGMAQHHFAAAAATSRSLLCTEVMAGGPPQSRDRPHGRVFRCRRGQVAGGPDARRGRSAATFPMT